MIKTNKYTEKLTFEMVKNKEYYSSKTKQEMEAILKKDNYALFISLRESDTIVPPMRALILSKEEAGKYTGSVILNYEDNKQVDSSIRLLFKSLTVKELKTKAIVESSRFLGNDVTIKYPKNEEYKIVGKSFNVKLFGVKTKESQLNNDKSTIL